MALLYKFISTTKQRYRLDYAKSQRSAKIYATTYGFDKIELERKTLFVKQNKRWITVA